ncbi:MAG: hypothetical protein EBZ29_12235 [Synechococcaceae bacterium WB9_4xC_028]|nr:hypothetical protein [Synechococcaceae bacterium WB9_4xC_028]
MVETEKAHLRTKLEQLLRLIKLQSRFQKMRYRDFKKNRHKPQMLFAPANLYKMMQRSPATA